MSHQKNKMVFLIAPPRSLSTAFLRMIDARGDFKIFNEPATVLYNTIHFPDSKDYYQSKKWSAYHDITEKLYSSLLLGNVFIKEMSFAFEAFINNETPLLEDKQIYFIFLLRNPHHCILSYYKKIPPEHLDFMMPHLARLTGYRALYNSFKLIQTHAYNKPYVIHAEKLIQDTAPAVGNLCAYLDIPFYENSLHWECLGEDFTGEIWHETKKKNAIYHWHHEALLSRGFHASAGYAMDSHGQPAFSEISNAAHKKICLKVYEDYQAYYELIANSQGLGDFIRRRTQ
ncbi:hypothetical protein [Legionella londiniensis]|uniref:Sulfotransferase family protein n=1 Tax=Legionella londiniensis TaxID=45068 RepID=A0A0W0VRJ1_9GAMM|nr:hypothetical protein [Legionella londiniensis]KTD22573.1 hypothetical protein Llon_0447 [Legionella londiniensis]STX92504.1 Uncharacterised protein [Legionella londiniensis]